MDFQADEAMEGLEAVLDDAAPSAGAAMEVQVSESPSSRTRNRLFQRKRGGQFSSAAPASELSAAPAPSQSQDVAEREDAKDEQSNSTEALEALALPADYVPPPAADEVNEAQADPWWLAESARQLLAANKHTEALATATAGLALSQENSPALSMLHYVSGRAHRFLGNELAAREAFEKAIALNAAR
jgi:hypothetical protein